MPPAEPQAARQMDAITASIIARRGVQLPAQGAHAAAVSHPNAQPLSEQTPTQTPSIPTDHVSAEVPLSLPAQSEPQPQPGITAAAVAEENAAKKSERPRAQQLLGQPLDATGFSYRAAHEIDDWAARIEQVNATGLYRLFLLHSVPRLAGSALQLTVASSEQHLETEEFRHRIEQLVLAAYPGATEVQISYQPDVADCPRDIQLQLDQARQDYVQRVMAEDPVLLAIRQNLAAEFIEDSLVVN